MKTIKYFILLISIICSASFASAQSVDIPSDIITAFNNGDSGKLSNYMNANVELVIGEINDVYSKQQASGILNNFFKKNKVSSFTILHKGNKESASFVIGILKTANQNYRLYLLIRKVNNLTVIQQLRIEPSND